MRCSSPREIEEKSISPLLVKKLFLLIGALILFVDYVKVDRLNWRGKNKQIKIEAVPNRELHPFVERGFPLPSSRPLASLTIRMSSLRNQLVSITRRLSSFVVGTVARDAIEHRGRAIYLEVIALSSLGGQGRSRRGTRPKAVWAKRRQ